MQRRPVTTVLALCVAAIFLAVLSRPLVPQTAPEERPLWAVAVGISQFANLPKDDWLEYAHADAIAFRNFIVSERGRSFPEKNALLMINENAGHQAVRTRLADTLPKRVKADDSVYIFLATHGVVEVEPANEGYLLGYDSDRENLYSTTLRMQELAYILQTRIKAKRMFVFADACRSGKLGQAINSQFVDLSRKRTETMLLLASRPGELSREGSQYQGHGAFTFCLIKGLMGEADTNKDNTVTASELVSYMQTQVPSTTGNQQHVRELGDYEAETPMAFPDRPGPAASAGARGPLWLSIPAPLANLEPQLPAEAILRAAFDKALQQGKLIEASDSAWDLYERSARVTSSETFRDELRDELLIALTTAGEKTIRAYRRGDQVVPLDAAEYEHAATLFSHATQLDPDNREHRAKARFLAGRALVSRERFTEATQLLRESISLDSRTAYAYNALGIAFMEQRQWTEAMRNFHDALARADKWIYPRANLARVYVAIHRYDEAEHEFLKGIETGGQLGIKYGYLHYNLGALYLEQKRTAEAREQFQRAVEANAADSRSHYHLALIDAEQGHPAAAETHLRKAIESNATFTDAWLRLATIYARQQRFEEEAKILQQAAAANPSDARIAETLGRRLLERGALPDAEQAALGLLALAPESPAPFMLLGDVHAAQRRLDEAAEDYRQAMQRAPDDKTREALRKRADKLRGQK